MGDGFVVSISIWFLLYRLNNMQQKYDLDISDLDKYIAKVYRKYCYGDFAFICQKNKKKNNK